MKRILSLLLACAMALGLCVVGCAANSGMADPPAETPAGNSGSFSDLSPGAGYTRAVAWCVENGLMNGVSGDALDPDGSMTRAMLATVLYRQAGEPSITEEPEFTDVLPNAWYSDAVVWASERNILRGYGNGLFGLEDPVSKEMLAVVMARRRGEDPVWTGDSALAVDAARSEAAIALFETFGEQGSPSVGGKVLVAYYSAAGSTESVAEITAEELGADSFELVPIHDYSSADLNYHSSSSRVNLEHEDESKRDVPLVSTTPDNWLDYDVVFIGYPIWWGTAAWPVNHFVTDNDFTGKVVIPFCTSASSDLGESGEQLAQMAGEGDWRTGQRFRSNTDRTTVANWVKELELPCVPTVQEEKTLVVYFSMPDNMDTSTVTINGEILGNNQYMAQIIQGVTNADIFRIEAAEPYPTDHAALVEQADQERRENARPEIKETIKNFDRYDTIFVGYPIWHADLPMILYTFFDSYDFSGKTLIPFGTHGGSGWAGTPAVIERLEPDADILEGLSISRNVIEDAYDQIVNWVKGLNIEHRTDG